MSWIIGAFGILKCTSACKKGPIMYVCVFVPTLSHCM